MISILSLHFLTNLFNTVHVVCLEAQSVPLGGVPPGIMCLAGECLRALARVGLFPFMALGAGLPRRPRVVYYQLLFIRREPRISWLPPIEKRSLFIFLSE